VLSTTLRPAKQLQDRLFLLRVERRGRGRRRRRENGPSRHLRTASQEAARAGAVGAWRWTRWSETTSPPTRDGDAGRDKEKRGRVSAGLLCCHLRCGGPGADRARRERRREPEWRPESKREAGAKSACAEAEARCARPRAGDFRGWGGCGRAGRCALHRGDAGEASGMGSRQEVSETARGPGRRRGPARALVLATGVRGRRSREGRG
jgi:hypothetical protein